MLIHGLFCCLCHDRHLSTYSQRHLICPSMGYSAAFAKKSHILQFLRGIDFGISRVFCCLSSWGYCPSILERHQFLDFLSFLLPFVLGFIFSPTQKAADRPTLSLICCLCQKSILNPTPKGSRPTHLKPSLLPLPKITPYAQKPLSYYLLFPMQLHHHHIVVQRFNHLAKHIRGAKPQR